MTVRRRREAPPPAPAAGGGELRRRSAPAPSSTVPGGAAPVARKIFGRGGRRCRRRPRGGASSSSSRRAPPSSVGVGVFAASAALLVSVVVVAAAVVAEVQNRTDVGGCGGPLARSSALRRRNRDGRRSAHGFAAAAAEGSLVDVGLGADRRRLHRVWYRRLVLGEEESAMDDGGPSLNGTAAAAQLFPSRDGRGARRRRALDLEPSRRRRRRQRWRDAGSLSDDEEEQAGRDTNPAEERIVDDDYEHKVLRSRESSRSPRRQPAASTLALEFATAAASSSARSPKYDSMKERGYGCYRTVKGMYDTLKKIARNRPNLAELIDVGDSQEKESGRGPGSDLWVLKLTNKSRPGGHQKKGILFAIFGVHAREYAPPEIAARFTEYLVRNYGRDADVTALLDTTEIHLLPVTNPDGRKIAEVRRKAWWRKNTNPDPNRFGRSCDKPGFLGVDLNRNFGFMWGRSDGSSGNPCEGDFRGQEPFSEPETQAVRDYAASIFPPEQFRDDPEDDADVQWQNTDDSFGMFLDVHAYGRLVIWPWSYKDEKVRNYDEYQALGHKVCSYNGAEPSGSGMDNFLYEVSGGGTDWAWGSLGVPSLLFEVGRRFDPPCATFRRSILPGELDALLYAASVSARPFSIAKGPDVLELTLSPRKAGVRGEVRVTAEVSDAERADLPGEEDVPSGRQNVAEVRMYVDKYPDYTNPTNIFSTVVRMDASDGRFDEPTERAETVLQASTLPRGRHTVCVVGVDSDGYAGPRKCAFLGVGCDPDPGGDCRDVQVEGKDASCETATTRRACARRRPECLWRRRRRFGRKTCVSAAGRKDRNGGAVS